MPFPPSLLIQRPLSSSRDERQFLAEQRELGRLVRLVTLPEEVLPTSPKARALLREAKNHSVLRHPNIAQVFAVHQGAELWIEFEFEEGADLAEYAAHAEPKEILSVFRQLALALAHGASVGIFHGDLSLHRVQVTAQGRAILRGFSVRSQEDLDLGPLRGAECPECARGLTYNSRSDVYLFGKLLEETVSLHPNRRSGFPPELSHLMTRCTAERPGDRPANFHEIASWIEALGAAPGPVPPRRIPRSSALRNLLLASAVGALAGAGLYAAWAHQRARLQQERPASALLVPIIEQTGSTSAQLQVIAHPWAHVFVDGEHQATTPFAAPLVLTPGEHVIRLEHPQADPQERTIQIARGQTALLDVALTIHRPFMLDRPTETPVETTP